MSDVSPLSPVLVAMDIAQIVGRFCETPIQGLAPDPDALVSWQSSLFEAKQSGCEILDAPGQSFGLRPVCSLIRSRSVLFNSNSYLSGEPKGIAPARIYKEEFFNETRSCLLRN